MPAEVGKFKAWSVKCPECNSESLVTTKGKAIHLAAAHNKMAHAKGVLLASTSVDRTLKDGDQLTVSAYTREANEMDDDWEAPR